MGHIGYWSVLMILICFENFLEASRDVGLGIYVESTKCMIMSSYPNSGQNLNIRIAN
jgi:hypothetical protein